MIRPIVNTPVYLYAGFVDIRKSIDGLAALIEQETELSPFETTLFAFCNRQRGKIKLLQWERNGFVLWYKRLEKFRFQWPDSEMTAHIDGEWLKRLLDGYDIRPPIAHPELHYTIMT